MLSFSLNIFVVILLTLCLEVGIADLVMDIVVHGL